METIPNYDNWKGRSSEDDAEMHEHRTHASDGGFFFDTDKNAEAPVHVDRRDALIKELVEAVGNFICFCEENDTIGRGIDFILLGGERFELDEMRAVLKKAKDAGYE